MGEPPGKIEKDLEQMGETQVSIEEALELLEEDW